MILELYGFDVEQIEFEKPIADVYVDDKGYNKFTTRDKLLRDLL